MRKKSYFTNSIYLIALSAFLLTTGISGLAQGYGSNQSSTQDLVDKDINLRAQKVNTAIKDCDLVLDKVQYRSLFLESSISSFQSRYQGVFTKLEVLSQKLKAEGVDAKNIEAVNSKLKNKLNTFDSNGKTLMTDMKLLTEYSCSRSEADFLKQLDKSRKSLDSVLSVSKEMETLLKDDLKDEVIKIK